LDVSDFQQLFKMTREEFKKLPIQRRKMLKKDVYLEFGKDAK